MADNKEANSNYPSENPHGRPLTPSEIRKKKKRRRQIRRRIILLIIIAFFAFCFIFGMVRIRPLYRESRSTMYNVLAGMDEGTFKRATNTTVYDKDGKLIGKIGYENYKYVDITDISMFIQNGYIAAEDKNFKTHHGVDWGATARAAFALIRNHGKITQGGSTITQQVVKNNLLSQKQTYERKIMEILLARQLEKEYTKADIMEYYCNSNYYGNSCYGVEGASQYYFGKSAKDVDLAEAAMLVGTSNLPNEYNPVADYDTCMKKKKQVLGRMLDEGYITRKQYKQAVAEKPEIKQVKSNVGSENYMTTYAVHCAALKLMEKQGFDFRYTFSSKSDYKKYTSSYNSAYDKATQMIRDGGYTINTSLDQKIQKKLQKSISRTMKGETEKQSDGRYDIQAAGMCIDNKTGMVVAIVGGRDSKDSYNRGFQAKRQPGSSIKPLLVYGPGVNEGLITPATVYNDHKIDINGYSPSNSGGSYYGNVTIREALARSLNTVAVQVLYDNSVKTGLSYLGKLHFSTLSFADRYNLAVALGGFTNGVTLEDMAKGYATLENGGEYRDNTCLVSLTSETDGNIYTYKNKGTQVYSADTAFIMTDMMEGVFNSDYGTAHKYRNKDQVYAGKTGTTNGSRDAWFAGYSAYYTTVTWVGCDTPRTIKGLYGSGYPAQIWSSFMDDLHENLEKKEFDVPDTVLLSNKSGRERKVTYTKNIWSSRPKGWDYVSGELKDKVAETAEKKRIQREVNAAETAVSEFEDFQINNVTEAQQLDQKYQDCLDVIEQIEDDSQQKTFKERAAYKYSLLNDDVKDNWEKAIQEQEKKEQEEKDIANKEAAQQSSETALSQVKNARISAVEAYISALNNRTIYTSSIEDLYQDGLSALEDCSDYSEYDSLSSRLNAAVEKARKLPTEDEVLEERKAAEKKAEKARKKAAKATDPEIQESGD